MNLKGPPFLLTVMSWFLIVGGVFAGCSKSTVEDLENELRDKAYVRTMLVGNHRLEFRYVPAILRQLTLSGLDKSHTIDRNLMDSLNSSMGSESGILFHLTVAPRVDTLPPTDFRNDVIYGRISGHQDYRSTLKEFTTGLEDNLWLEYDGKRIDLAGYQLSNSWGLTKDRTLTLLFPTPGWTDNHQVLTLVAENLVPGMGREKFSWMLPVSKYESSI